jgi:aspartate aminotransferase
MDQVIEIIIQNHFMPNYNGFSASGVTVVPVISSIDTGFAYYCWFRRKIESHQKIKTILICNPGNPTSS